MASILSDIMDAVKTTIDGLGLASPAVYKKEVVTDRTAEGVDLTNGAIFVSKAPSAETMPQGVLGSNDIGYPVAVTIVVEQNQDFSYNDTPMVWREAIRNAFHDKRLTGVASSMICKVEPLPMIDLNLLLNENLNVNGMIIRCLSRETR